MSLSVTHYKYLRKRIIREDVTFLHSNRHMAVTKKNQFSREDKIRAIMEYRSSNNLSKAAQSVGCNRNALRRWIEEFKEVETVDPQVAEAYTKAIETAAAIRQTFLSEHYSALSDTIKKGIKRADELIQDANNLGSVVNAIKELASVIKEFTPTDETKNKPTINLLQQTINDHN